jgi:hypothetical protein
MTACWARDNDASSVLDGNDNLNVSGTALYDQAGHPDQELVTPTPSSAATRKAGGSLNDGTKTKQGNNYLSDNTGVLPGHGQVSPARWEKDGQVYQGFGRMFTLSEIGFQIICTADGKNDEQFPVTCGAVTSGGGSAPKALATITPNEGPAGGPPTYLTAAYPTSSAGHFAALGIPALVLQFPAFDGYDRHAIRL